MLRLLDRIDLGISLAYRARRLSALPSGTVYYVLVPGVASRTINVLLTGPLGGSVAFGLALPWWCGAGVAAGVGRGAP